MTILFEFSSFVPTPLRRARLGAEERLDEGIASDVRSIGLNILVFGWKVTAVHRWRIKLCGLDLDGNVSFNRLLRKRVPAVETNREESPA